MHRRQSSRNLRGNCVAAVDIARIPSSYRKDKDQSWCREDVASQIVGWRYLAGPITNPRPEARRDAGANNIDSATLGGLAYSE